MTGLALFGFLVAYADLLVRLACCAQRSRVRLGRRLKSVPGLLRKSWFPGRKQGSKRLNVWRRHPHDQSASIIMEEAGTMPNSVPSSVNASEKRGDLNPLQQRIVTLTISGYSSEEIAKKLGVSVPAAKRHLSRVCDKLRVSNPLELALYALHYQLVNDD